MALKDILAVIAADAEKEAGAIREAAEEAYRTRMQAAEAEASAIRATILAEVQHQAEHEKVKALHRVRLENLRQQVKVQQSAFLAAIQEAQQDLAGARRRPNYDDLLARLLEEATAFYDAPVVIVAHPDDRDRVEAEAHALGIKLYAIECRDDLAPGVVVRAVDSRVVVDNTLTSRLLRVTPDLHALLADLLGVDQSASKTVEAHGD